MAAGRVVASFGGCGSGRRDGLDADFSAEISMGPLLLQRSGRCGIYHTALLNCHACAWAKRLQ